MRTFVLGYEFPVKFNEKLTSPVMTMILLSERLQHHWIFFLYGSTRLFFSFLPFLHYSFFFWLYFQSCETDSTSLFKAYGTIQTTSKAIAKRVTPHTDLTTTTTWNLDPIYLERRSGRKKERAQELCSHFQTPSTQAS